MQRQPQKVTVGGWRRPNQKLLKKFNKNLVLKYLRKILFQIWKVKNKYAFLACALLDIFTLCTSVQIKFDIKNLINPNLVILLLSLHQFKPPGLREHHQQDNLYVNQFNLIIYSCRVIFPSTRGEF